MADETASLHSVTAQIVCAYAANSQVGAGELPELIGSVRRALELGSNPRPETPAEPQAKKATAAQIKKSVTHDALISFEDGRPYKTLKRHLSTLGMTIVEYRAKWSLPKDYPSVAPAYSAARSVMAKSIGLGNRREAQAGAPSTAKTGAAKAGRSRSARAAEGASQ